MNLYAAIAAGSVVGSLARWAVGLVAQPWHGALPWGTLFVNIAGSFAIGLYAELTSANGRWRASDTARQFVMTGVCGGFTTFSLFSLEVLNALQAGQSAQAALYVGVSLVTWLAAVWAGAALGEALNRR